MRATTRNLATSLSVQRLILLNEPQNNISIRGWLTSVQKFGKVFFLKINDGTCSAVVQTVVPKNLYSTVNVGSAVSVTGNWVKSLGSTQPMELLVDKLTVFGYNKEVFPPTDNDLLRKKLHLRPKNSSFASIIKLRSHLQFLSHKFFQDRNFTFIDTPMTSRNDCEGAGEIFAIKSFTDDDFFGDGNVFLPVSGQLHLEAVASAIPNVYTMGPVFRADKSLTRQHLSEFRMLEAECAFTNNVNDLCQIVEDFLRFMVDKIGKFEDDLDVSAPLCKRTKHLLKCMDRIESIPRISYTEAVGILKLNNETDLDKLSKQHELRLVDLFKGPVFILNYPSKNKPFYMKRSFDGLLVENFDLLAPFVGELAGGSVREDNINKLRSRLSNTDGSEDDFLSWYLELRNCGYPTSGGFGIGVDRLVQSLFGIENIKDATPFPRWYKHCKC